MNRLEPVSPGEVLFEEFLKPLGIGVPRLANDLGVSVARLQGIVSECCPLTAEVALRLSRYFHTSPKFWLNLQLNYDLEVARDELGERLATEVRPQEG